MATIKYLLTAANLKDLTSVHGNVDEDLINESIISCQDLFIERTIGSALYDYLLDNIASLGSDYVTLLEDYVHPAMKYWIQADLVDTLSNRFTNVGVVNKTGENVESLSDENKRRTYSKYMNKATSYARRLFDYLVENDSTFTLFKNPGTGYDDLRPTRRKYPVGIFLGGVRGKTFDGLDTFSDEEYTKG